MTQALTHQAVKYESTDDFVDSVTPFVREGLELGEPVFVVIGRGNLDALREALGPDAAGVELLDTAEWFPHAYERLQQFRQLADEIPEGATLRALGEPPWGGSDAVNRQWTRFESVSNLALAQAPMQVLCPYDASSLPDEVLDGAGCTHPELIEEGGAVASPAFVSPREFRPGPPPAPPPSAARLPVEPVIARIRLRELMDALGVPAARHDDVVLAAQELMSNASIHGLPPVEAFVWVDHGELICQVTDHGTSAPEPLAGWIPPDRPAGGGWGLPIARQLGDALDVAHGENGTVATLYVELDA